MDEKVDWQVPAMRYLDFAGFDVKAIHDIIDAGGALSAKVAVEWAYEVFDHLLLRDVALRQIRPYGRFVTETKDTVIVVITGLLETNDLGRIAAVRVLGQLGWPPVPVIEENKFFHVLMGARAALRAGLPGREPTEPWEVVLVRILL